MQIQLRNVRLSYANIWSPVQARDKRGNERGEPKFSVALLIDKRDKKNRRTLADAVKEVMSDPKLARVNPNKLDKGIRDGDEKYVGEGDDILDGYEGHIYINAKAGETHPPQIVDNRRRPITDESKVYSGCYANVFVSVYAYDNESSGVGFGLLGIQKTADGDPLGSTFSSDMFDEFDAEYEDDDDIGGQFDDFGDSRRGKHKQRDDDFGDDGSEDFDDFDSDRRGKKKSNRRQRDDFEDDDDFGPSNRNQRKGKKNRRQRDDEFDDDFEDEDFGPDRNRGRGRKRSIDIDDDDLPF